MKFVLIVAVLGIAVDSVLACEHQIKFHNLINVTGNITADFLAFMKAKGRNLDKLSDKRLKKFKEHVEKLFSWNATKEGYCIDVNHRTLMTDEEKAKSKNNKLNPINTDTSALDARFAIQDPNAFNQVRQNGANFSWVDQGAVTTVKDQGQCGCCYTFAAAAALEGAYKIKHGVLVNVSTQQYVDCSVNYTVTTSTRTSTSCKNGVCTSSTKISDNWFLSPSGNEACNGGTPKACWAFNNLTGTSQNTWECYGFVSGTTEVGGTCQRPACSISISVSGYVTVPSNNETALLSAVSTSPVACAIDASTLDPYAGGIFTGGTCSPTNLNHAITVVGYGTAGGVDYWLIKNSWGPTWGENGYVRFYRGNNTCGIASSCAYPVVI